MSSESDETERPVAGASWKALSPNRDRVGQGFDGPVDDPYDYGSLGRFEAEPTLRPIDSVLWEKAAQKRLVSPAAAGVVAASMIAVIGFFGLGGTDLLETVDEEEPGGTVATADPSPASSALSADVAGAAAAEDDSAREPFAGVAVPEGVYVRAILSANEFVLSGVVPDEAAAGLLVDASGIYAPIVRPEFMVDEQLPPADWLHDGPFILAALSLVTNGTLQMSESEILVAGQVATATEIDRLVQSLAETSDLPVDVSGVQVTGLRPPSYVVAAVEGQVTISGALPNGEVHARLVGDVEDLYGQENTVDQTVVDPSVHTAPWMITANQLVQELFSFPNYEIRFADGLFSGSISQGIDLDSEQGEISAAWSRILDLVTGMLKADPSLEVKVTGHTDSTGSNTEQHDLSHHKTDLIADYLAAAGIAPERIATVGMSADDPIAPQNTDEGKARNQRAEVEIEAAHND